MIQQSKHNLPERFAFFAVVTIFALCPAGLTLARSASAPADRELLKIVPPDAGLTITINDLRGHAAELGDSKLARAFFELPAVKAWFNSQRGQALRKARAEIETNLGVPLKTIRDDLIGDAVVLSLHIGADKGFESARGLALSRVRDPKLLEKMISLLNKSDAGFLATAEVGTNENTYSVRRFKPETGREPEYFRLFADGTFAWSNSEELIKAVVSRKLRAGSDGLADDADFGKVRSGLPARSLVTLVFSGSFATRIVALCTQPSDAKQARLAEVITRNIQALKGLGLAIEWRNGFILHAHEVIDPQKLDPRIVTWGKSKATADRLAQRVPATALALAAMAIDAPAIFHIVGELTTDVDRPRFDAFLVVLQGLLLGRDVPGQVLPALGPGLLAYVDEPGTGWPRFPVVAVLQLRDDGKEPSLAHALDNAIRTVISVFALDSKRSAARFKLVSTQKGTLRVTSFAASSIPFAYAVGPDCLILGTSADAVARFGSANADTHLAPFKAAHCADAQAYAVVDLSRLVRIARDHREGLAQRLAKSRGTTPEAAGRDLDQALDLLNLFQGAFLATHVDPELSYLHQSVGLIAK